MKNRKNGKKIFITILFVLSAFLYSCSNHISDITSGTQPQPVIPIIPESGDPTPEPTPTPVYTVTCTCGEHGSITVDKTNVAAGEIVSISIIYNTGYKLNILTVTDSNGNHITVTQRTFIMPDSDVIVYANFETIGAITMKIGQDINEILKNELKADTVAVKFIHSEALPSGVTSFTLSQDSSEVPVYAWLDGTTIYFYAEGYTDSQSPINRIPLNANSRHLFFNCKKLEEIEISYFDTSEVINMRGMFWLCENLKSLDFSNFNTSNVTNMEGLFLRCYRLQSLDLSTFDTTAVTNMGSMFQFINLESIDLSSFNTSNVTDMSLMFYNCKNLKSLNLSSFNTSNVTDMSSMFEQCENLESVDLSSFVTSNVTDMSLMFKQCENLVSLNLSNFNTSNVTDMSSMFERCENLESINLSSFVTSNVTDMSSMFKSCSTLQTLDLTNFATEAVTNMLYMFYSCSNLTTIYASDLFVTTAVTDGRLMFGATCGKLVGEQGTNYSNSYTDSDCSTSVYARIDNRNGGAPGYFTSGN